jgi:basic membrane protein A
VALPPDRRAAGGSEREQYAIGVDTSQNDLEPGYVIASDIKNVAKAIEAVYATINDGSYKPGVRSEWIKQGGVDMPRGETVLPQAIMIR